MASREQASSSVLGAMYSKWGKRMIPRNFIRSYWELLLEHAFGTDFATFVSLDVMNLELHLVAIKS
jgi:hypothetical protein